MDEAVRINDYGEYRKIGTFQPESVALLLRIGWHFSNGITGTFAPEYASEPLPDNIKRDIALYSGCVAGASLIDDLHKILEVTGFKDIRITPKSESKDFIRDWFPGKGLESFIVSSMIETKK